MKRWLIILSWLTATGTTLILSLFFYQHLSELNINTTRPKTVSLNSDTLTSKPILPEVLGAFSFKVKTDDAIPEIIKNYLAKYDSPLLPDADYLIATARKYNFDPRLLVAIAQQESNLCKKIPDNSFNCWGWGIHSQGTLRFSSYQQAIDAVAKGLAKNYLNKGRTTPEEIMAVYTPASEGSWARGVQQFLNEME